MDIRITNNCNNNCLYCLEQSYRNREKFISLDLIKNEISKNTDKNMLNFYGGNPLLYPRLNEIILHGKKTGFSNIGILTNTYGLVEKKIDELIYLGLNNFGFYFNSFIKKNHNILVNGGIDYNYLMENISIISKKNIYKKAIIHVNNLNIKELPKIVNNLYFYFGIENYEFINYFPFDRAFKYHKILSYNIDDNKNFIDNLFKIIEKYKIKNVNFYKFSIDFFGEYKKFYDYENGIIKQIGNEDIKMFNDGNFDCYFQNKCNSCFLKDYHKFKFLNN